MGPCRARKTWLVTMTYLITLIATAIILREITTLDHWIAFDAWVLRVLTLGKPPLTITPKYTNSVPLL